MNIVKKVALCACLFFVGCNENDHDQAKNVAIPTTTPAIQSIAKGTLTESVRVLSDAENASIVSNTENSVTFSGAINFAPNTVVVGQDIAFKVVSISSEAGNTVVSKVEPRLDELFDNLRIKGTFKALPSQAIAVDDDKLAKSAQAVSVSTTAVPLFTDTFLWSSRLSNNGMTVASNLSGSVTVAADYDYQKDKGGLQFAKLDVDTGIDISASTSFSKGGTVSVEKLVGQIRIPIPVTIADKFLSLVGIRIVSIYVPVYLGAGFKSSFDMSLKGKVKTSGSLKLNYDTTNGSSLNSDYKASVADESPFPKSPSGAPVFASFSENLELYLRLKPSLAFLGTVAMLGIDSKASANGAGVLQVVPDMPFYCLSLTPTASLSAKGFFKGVGIKEIATNTLTKTLYTGSPHYFGTCKAPTAVEVVSINPTTGKYGQTLDIKTKVSLDLNSQSTAPSTPPSGEVEIQIGTQTCKAKLTDKETSKAMGSCSLKPLQAGVSVPISLKYSGDEKYTPATGSSLVNIDKAPTFVGMTTTPNPSSSGESVTFSASVTPMPFVDGDPTGSIMFQDAQKNSVCSMNVVSGRAECSAVVTSSEPSMVKNYTALYSGDENFLSSTSSSHAHDVKPTPTGGMEFLLRSTETCDFVEYPYGRFGKFSHFLRAGYHHDGFGQIIVRIRTVGRYADQTHHQVISGVTKSLTVTSDTMQPFSWTHYHPGAWVKYDFEKKSVTASFKYPKSITDGYGVACTETEPVLVWARSVEEIDRIDYIEGSLITW